MFDEAARYDGPERRQVERFATAVAIGVREGGMHSLPATLVSLSSAGCGVANVTLNEGDGTVWIRIPGLESLPARRCWLRYGAAGLAFDHPLHPAVANRFRMAQPSRAVPFEVDYLALGPAAGERTTSRRQQIMAGEARPEHLRLVDKRREPRFPAPAEAASGFMLDDDAAALSNISTRGLKLDDQLDGEVGSPVKVAFAGYPEIEGTIVWVRDGATGVRLPDDSLHLYEAA